MMIKALLSLFFCCITGLALGQNLASKIPRVIHLATTDWCPYACEADVNHQAGMVHEYLTQIFSEQGIQLKIEFFPWSRAIKQVDGGRLDGLLTAVHAEAPNLLFTHAPTMGYRVCFYTRKTIKWRYGGIDSLKEINLAVIQDYGYGEPLDDYINNLQPHGLTIIKSGGITRLLRMLMADRFDVFIGDSNVVAWRLQESMNVLRNAGCLNENPFYVAFNPQREWAAKLIKKLDVWLKTAKNLARLKKLQLKYVARPSSP